MSDTEKSTCKRCGKPCHAFQVFCGAFCCAKWEAGDRAPKDAELAPSSGSSAPSFEVFKRSPGKVPARMLVSVHEGLGLVLLCSAPNVIQDFLRDTGAGQLLNGEPCPMSDVVGGDDKVDLPDGIHVADIVIVDDGPGDWPGSRETCLEARGWRCATRKEWVRHLRGEWPWDVQDEPEEVESQGAVGLEGKMTF